MSKEKKTVDPEEHLTKDGRKDIVLGENFDGSQTILPGYVDIDGVQVHPDRVEDYLKRKHERVCVAYSLLTS